MKKALLFSFVLFLAMASGAWASTVLSGGTGYITVSNDAGRFYNGSLANTDPTYNQFYFDFTQGGGGLNQLKINSDATSSVSGQLTGTATSGSYNDNFWLTTNGGKGGNDDMILGVALTGPIFPGFQITIVSNGYVVAPSATTRPTVTSANWQTDVLDETFDGSDFIYGPQPTRPASSYQPLYNGQGSATGMLMFVDLGVANRVSNLSDQVVFTVNGLYTGDVLAFSAYAYDLIAGNTGSDFIGWTTPTAATGYTVTGAGDAPVPIPGAILLFGPGLAGLAFVRRKFGK